MASVKILKAKVSDSQKIRELENRIWNEEVVNKYDIPMFVRFGYSYIAKYKDKIVGAIIAYKTKDDEVYVCDWIVEKKFRKSGIGLKLYKSLIKNIRDLPIVSFIEQNNTPSLNAHFKLGFKIVKKIKDPYDLGEGYRIFVRRCP